MATSVDGIETVGEVAGTTPYDYEGALPCEKSNVKELAAQFLPPLYSLVFMIGLLGNVVVVVILTKYKRLRIMTNIYLLNLAISDVLFLVTLPFWIHYVRWKEWVFGHHMCKLLSGLYYMGLYSEIFFIILLTINRYLAIIYSLSKLRCWYVTSGTITCIVTWVLAILASVPGFYFSKTQWWFTHYTCSLHFPAESHGRKWKQFLALKLNILGLILPLLIIIVCYRQIIKIMLRISNKKRVKAMHLIFVIMITFFLFWTPYDLTVFVSAFQDSLCEHCSQLDLAIEVTEAIAYAHCCVNPMVYVFFHGGSRRVLWDLLFS